MSTLCGFDSRRGSKKASDMNTYLFNLPDFNYENILRSAKRIDPVNYMDLAHDHILTGQSMKSLKYYYKTVNEVDYTIHQDTCQVCEKCNKIKPIAAFRNRILKGKKFTESICRACNTEKDKQRKIYLKNYIMKLVKIEVVSGKTHIKPTLTFSKNGMFTISSSLAELMKFKKGDNILFLKNEDKPKDWYICLSKNDGFPVQVTSGKYKSRKFQRKALLHVMKRTLNIPDTCNSFLIGTEVEIEGVSYFPLILNRSHN